MTVINQTKKVVGTGDGATTVFSFSPIVLPEDNDDLTVVHVSAAGVETVLTEGTGASNYSVSAITFPGTGSVTYPADEVTPMAADGEHIVMHRLLVLEQQTDLVNQGGYFPEVQENEFDRQVMIDLQQQLELDRALKVPLSDTGSDYEVERTASKYLKWNAAADGIDAVDVTTVASAASDVAALALGTAASGSGTDVSREDHVHPLTGLAVTTATDNVFLGTQIWTKGADVASAAALAIDIDGNYFDVTGTTTITSMNTKGVGTWVHLHFDAACTLTHHATDLVLLSGANITTAAGDEAMFIEYAVGDWRMVDYGRADGSPVIAPTAGRQTISVPATAMVARTSNGAATGKTETSVNKVMISTLDFDTAADEFAQFRIPMPKSWDLGVLQAQFGWSHTGGATFTVQWAIQAVAVGDDDTQDVAFGTAVLPALDTGGTNDDLYITEETGDITVAGTPAIGDEVLFQVYRDVSGDAHTGDARLQWVKIYYNTNSDTDD